MSLSALSASATHRVYRYREQRTLNLVTSPLFLIFTERASFRRAVRRNFLISSIFLGCRERRGQEGTQRQRQRRCWAHEAAAEQAGWLAR